MDVVIRDCSSYDTLVASLALNDADLLNKAKQEIYMNFSISLVPVLPILNNGIFLMNSSLPRAVD